jgi:hypothetical protein
MLLQDKQRLGQWGKKGGPPAADVLSNDWGSGGKKPAEGVKRTNKKGVISANIIV